jgi:hypothetical protein
VREAAVNWFAFARRFSQSSSAASPHEMPSTL